MTNELDQALNLFSSITNHFHNDLEIEIKANNLEDLLYEIKYLFFRIDFTYSSDQFNGPKVSSKFQKTRSGLVGEEPCGFKCPSSISNNNRTVGICLDEQFLCDNEIDCIYTDADELNCKWLIVN